MLTATGRAVEWEWSSALDHVRPRLIAHRLPLFALGWLLTTGIWGLVLVLEARLSVFPATVLFVFQLGVLVTAIAICHHGARPARIPIVALAACVLLGLSSTSLFAAIGGYGEMLAVILLTLFLASSPLFAWSGRAALVLLVGTLIPWLLAIPFLRFLLRPLDLSAGIAIAAGVSLIVLEGSKRNARLALERVTQAAATAGVEQVVAPALATAGTTGPAQMLVSLADDAVAAQPVAPQREIGSDCAPAARDEIAMLREPLLKLCDEEVAGLRKELRLLRMEVSKRVVETRPQVPRRGAIDDCDLMEIARLVRWIESDGRRRTDEELLREVMLELGFQRRGARIDATIRAAISRARTDESLQQAGAPVQSIR